MPLAEKALLLMHVYCLSVSVCVVMQTVKLNSALEWVYESRRVCRSHESVVWRFQEIAPTSSRTRVAAVVDGWQRTKDAMLSGCLSTRHEGRYCSRSSPWRQLFHQRQPVRAQPGRVSDWSSAGRPGGYRRERNKLYTTATSYKRDLQHWARIVQQLLPPQTPDVRDATSKNFPVPASVDVEHPTTCLSDSSENIGVDANTR